MARADLLGDKIRYGLNNDITNFRKAAEAICAEERAKQHRVLVNKIENMLKISDHPMTRDVSKRSANNGNSEHTLICERIPTRRREALMIPENVSQCCRELIEEQSRTDLLRSYGFA